MTARDPLLEHVREVVHEACQETLRQRREGHHCRRRPKLAAALELKKNAVAKRTFDAFTPGHRREYVEWISEVKRLETRARVAQTIVQLAEDKTLHRKYASH